MNEAIEKTQDRESLRGEAIKAESNSNSDSASATVANELAPNPIAATAHASLPGITNAGTLNQSTMPRPNSANSGEPKLSNAIPTSQVSANAMSSGIEPQGCGCGGSGTSSPLGYVFCIGSLQPTFPNPSLQQEFLYAYGQTNSNFPLQNAFYDVLSQSKYLYLAQEMCWVFQVDGVDAFIVKPRTDAELFYFIDSLDPTYMGQERYDVLIGTRGTIADPSDCNGLQLPIVTCDVSYHFTFDMFVDYWVNTITSSPNPPPLDATIIRNVIQDTLQQLLGRSVTEGEGASDSSRVINYLITRAPQVYNLALSMQQVAPSSAFAGSNFLSSIVIQQSAVNGNRSLYDVIFEYENKFTQQSTYWYLRVDVTGAYPFLVTNEMTQYFPNSANQ